jgi:hypothetical protein
MQGLVVIFDIHRITFQDDDVGGAVLTGTVIASSVRGHLNVLNPSQMSLEQGLEVPRLADVLIRPRAGSLTIFERDQLQIVGPAGHPNLNEFWRVENVQQPPMHPKNRKRFIRMRTSRVDRDRVESLM